MNTGNLKSIPLKKTDPVKAVAARPTRTSLVEEGSRCVFAALLNSSATAQSIRKNEAQAVKNDLTLIDHKVVRSEPVKAKVSGSSKPKTEPAFGQASDLPNSKLRSGSDRKEYYPDLVPTTIGTDLTPTAGKQDSNSNIADIKSIPISKVGPTNSVAGEISIATVHRDQDAQVPEQLQRMKVVDSSETKTHSPTHNAVTGRQTEHPTQAVPLPSKQPVSQPEIRTGRAETSLRTVPANADTQIQQHYDESNAPRIADPDSQKTAAVPRAEREVLPRGWENPTPAAVPKTPISAEKQITNSIRSINGEVVRQQNTTETTPMFPRQKGIEPALKLEVPKGDHPNISSQLNIKTPSLNPKTAATDLKNPEGLSGNQKLYVEVVVPEKFADSKNQTVKSPPLSEGVPNPTKSATPILEKAVENSIQVKHAFPGAEKSIIVETVIANSKTVQSAPVMAASEIKREPVWEKASHPTVKLDSTAQKQNGKPAAQPTLDTILQSSDSRSPQPEKAQDPKAKSIPVKQPTIEIKQPPVENQPWLEKTQNQPLETRAPNKIEELRSTIKTDQTETDSGSPPTVERAENSSSSNQERLRRDDQTEIEPKAQPASNPETKNTKNGQGSVTAQNENIPSVENPESSSHQDTPPWKTWLDSLPNDQTRSIQRLQNLRELTEKIQAQTRLLKSGETTALRVKLTPPQLGAVVVHIETEGTEVKLHFTADRPEAATALQDIRSDLSGIIAVQGYVLTQCEIESRAQPGRWMSGNPPKSDPHQTRDGSPDQENSSPEESSGEQKRKLDLGYNTFDLVA